MEKGIVEQWEKHKGTLKSYIKRLRVKDCDSYLKLVRILVSECLNVQFDGFNADEIASIDHGDCQGTEIFLFHEDAYQPSIEEYYILYVDYGSCSGCDTLKRIFEDYEEDTDPVSEKQAEGLMTLMLHMVQRIRRLGRVLERG